MSEPGELVDWGLARRTARALGGGGGATRIGYGASEVRAACESAIEAASAYSGLAVPADPPPAELVDREEWARNAIATLAEAAAPLESRLAGEITLPGPLGSAARRLIGAAAGAEAGVVVGFVSRRVLGQYDVSLFGRQRAARLLFVASNLEGVRAQLEADSELFLRWVAIHETTHVLQFESVPWLAGHVRALAAELIDGAVGGLDAERLRELVRRLAADPRALVRTLLAGELTRALADPKERALLDRLEATMAVIEGHAEHVMDACVAGDPRLERLRAALQRRREERGGLAEVVGRLLGMEQKLRQYALGKSFWDAIVEQRGSAALELAWRSPESLPNLAELGDPAAWLSRLEAPVEARR